MTTAVAMSVDEVAEQLRDAGFRRRDYLGVNNAAVTWVGALLQQDAPAEVTLADIRTVVAAFEVVDGEMFEEFETEGGHR